MEEFLEPKARRDVLIVGKLEYMPGKLIPSYDIEQEQQLDLQLVQSAAMLREQTQQFSPFQILLGK